VGHVRSDGVTIIGVAERRSERPDDLEVVRAVLARRRRLGEPFEAAWPTALSVLERPAATKAEEDDRGRTLSALNATVADWQLAYERKPPYPMFDLGTYAESGARSVAA
jgi:hypothetical protein